MSVFLLGLVGISWWLTGKVRANALARGILDVPNDRSSHSVVTPRGGGLAIVVVFFLGSCFLAILGLLPLNLVGAVLLTSGGIALAGWVDDKHHLSAWIRLGVQFFSALVICAVVVNEFVEPELFSSFWLMLAWFLVSTFLLVAFTNFYNFMDGIDGLAAVEAIMVTLCAATLLWFSNSESELGVWLLVLGATVVGFLVWNWAPAKIFMGDVGSAFLGFVLGAMALITVAQGSLSLMAWLILLGGFLVDSSVTLLRRILRGERWYQAHRSHAYQNLSRRLGSHSSVVLIVILINGLWLFPLAIAALSFESGSYIIVCIALLPLALLALMQGAGTEKY